MVKYSVEYMANSITAFPTIMAKLIAGYGQVSIAQFVITNGEAKVTTSGSHSFRVGMVAEITGSTTPGINGEYKVIATNGSDSFVFNTNVTGTVSGAMSAKVAPFNITVHNPVANIYYYGIGNKYIKAENQSGSRINFFLTDDLLDTNITAGKSFERGTNYMIATDGNFFYCFTDNSDTGNGTLVYAPVGSINVFRNSLNFGVGTSGIGLCGFVEHTKPCSNTRTAGPGETVDIPISVWDGRDIVHGILPNLADIAFAKNNSLTNGQIYFHCKKTYYCVNYTNPMTSAVEVRMVDVS